jgi:DNA-binding CsgD family transcriptional regulator
MKYRLLDVLSKFSNSATFIIEPSKPKLIWANKNFLHLTSKSEGGINKDNLIQIISTNPQIHSILKGNIQNKKNNISFISSNFCSLLCIPSYNGNQCKIHVNSVMCKIPASKTILLIGFIIDLTPYFSTPKFNSPTQYSKHTISKNPLDIREQLTNREIEIVKLIAKGHTDREIAQVLLISYSTASTHRKNILKKLKIKNTARLAYIAGKNGIE